MEFSLTFAAAACNSVVNCCSWGERGSVAYGAHHAVFIYDPKEYVVSHSIRAHSGRVNAVQWMHFGSHSWLISGGSDGKLVISFHNDETCRVVCGAALGDTSITDIAVHRYTWLRSGDGEEPEDAQACFWIAVTSTDCVVRLFTATINENDLTCSLDMKQKIPCVPRMMECVALCIEPVTQRMILAMGGADSMIHLYVCAGEKFIFLLSLSGHRDWVRSLDFAIADDGDVLLASSAQDNFIRLWRIRPCAVPPVDGGESIRLEPERVLNQRGQTFLLYPMVDDAAKKDVEAEEKDAGGGEGCQTFTAVLDAVLVGHDAWVLSVQWHPRVRGTQPLALLSASQDRAMMIWEPERSPSSMDRHHRDGDEHVEEHVDEGEDVLGVWLPTVRMGDVGGNVLGFFRGEWSPSGDRVLGHGYHGSFHLWKHHECADASSKRWAPMVAIGGHFDAVVDMMWDPSYTYLLTTSADQTTRLWAQWTRAHTSGDHEEGAEDHKEAVEKEHSHTTASSTTRSTWHEVARPQIHGYDQRCLSFVRNRSHQYLAGAEEKVLRVFNAPTTFVSTLSSITKQHVLDDAPEHRSMGANVPPLGLSNRPIQGADVARAAEEVTTSATSFREELTISTPARCEEPPYEEFLLGSSLWPETQKLYGHGNELVCITSSRDGNLVASSCKASKPTEAAILLWDTTTWKVVQQLAGHRLTVVRMDFSPNDTHLLSVSRDRALTIFKAAYDNDGDGDGGVVGYHPVVRVAKAHDRIIWDCAWAPGIPGVFATASRDKKVKVWRLVDDKVRLMSTLSFRSAVTAIDWLPIGSDDASDSPRDMFLGVGLESGDITIHACSIARTHGDGDDDVVHWSSKKGVPIPPHLCPTGKVVRMEWRRTPEHTAATSETHQLAVASQDHSVRLYTICAGGKH